MWLFTKHGFFSVVSKPVAFGSRDAVYHVRSRLKSHLEAIKKLFRVAAPIVESKHNDYRWRMVVSVRVWKRIGPLLVAATEIDYSNFKSEVAKRKGFLDPYERALHEVWSVMNRVQTNDGKPAKKANIGDAYVPDESEDE